MRNQQTLRGMMLELQKRKDASKIIITVLYYGLQVFRVQVNLP